MRNVPVDGSPSAPSRSWKGIIVIYCFSLQFEKWAYRLTVLYVVVYRASTIKVFDKITKYWPKEITFNPMKTYFLSSYCLKAIVSAKRNWTQCLCKILKEQQRVLWYFQKRLLKGKFHNNGWFLFILKDVLCTQRKNFVQIVSTDGNKHKMVHKTYCAIDALSGQI